MRILHSKVLFLAVLILAPSVLRADVWNIDSAHSSARFKVRHMMVTNVGGEITGMKGTFNLNDKDITALKANATLDATTITTNNAKRDAHLKSADFFDTGKFPTIKFVSKKVAKKDGDKFQVVGALTMHGVTKEVAVDFDAITPSVKGMDGAMHRGLSGTTKINRKDFGIVWNKTMDGGGVAVGDSVDVSLDFEIVADKKV